MKVLSGADIARGGTAQNTFSAGTAVSIGNFDGVHRGHREILARLMRRAEELGTLSVVMTFDPHPRKVLSGPEGLKLITGLNTKCRIFESLGLDYLIKMDFTSEFAALSPQEFIEKWLMLLSPRAVVIGYDFNFGRGGAGTFDILEAEGRKRGFTVEMVEALSVEGMTVSSSRIRNLIEGGEVGTAEKLLGRPYSVFGKVIKGHGRGQRLGFPTANVGATEELLPCDGVYAGEVVIDNQALPAMVNIGANPTFEDMARSVEACILNFNDDIYGKEIEVRFRDRIRSEIKFPDPEALVEQIKHDQKTIERFFQSRGTSK